MSHFSKVQKMTLSELQVRLSQRHSESRTSGSRFVPMPALPIFENSRATSRLNYLITLSSRQMEESFDFCCTAPVISANIYYGWTLVPAEMQPNLDVRRAVFDNGSGPRKLFCRSDWCVRAIYASR